MRLTAIITTILFLLCSIMPALGAQRGVSSIDISASPSTLPSDGKSVSTVSAEVWDSNGQHAPDGTMVHFTSSMGVIEESASTMGGIARVRLVSADIPGECVLTATWIEGQAVSHISVPFGNVVTEPEGLHYIGIDKADYLAYSVDYKTMDALGHVTIRYRNMRIEAKEVQINTETGRLVARGIGEDEKLRIYKKDGETEGDMLTISMFDLNGLLLSSDKGKVQKIDLSKQVPEFSKEDAVYTPDDFNLADLSDSAVLIKAKAATIFMNDKIQFTKARVYVDGKGMLSLPYYLYSLTGVQEEGQQYVGYSTGGITLNLPYYYALTPSFSGSVHVRHGDKTGWGDFGQTPGWFIDLSQKYDTGNGNGDLTIQRMTDQNWGLNLSHTQSFGKDTNGYLYFDSPNHKDTYANVSVSHSMHSADIGLGIYNTHSLLGSNSMNTNVYLQTRAKPIAQGSKLMYTLSARSAYTKDSLASLSGMNNSAQGNIYTTPIALSKALSLRSSLGLGYVWGDLSAKGLSTIGTAVLDWKVSNYNRIFLNYRYADRATVLNTLTTTQQIGKHTLSLNALFTDGKKWNASIYGIKGLDYPTMSLFADLNYRMSPEWRFGISSTTNRYGIKRYDDLELSLGKIIGSRELNAVWSQSQKKIMFELGSGGF